MSLDELSDLVKRLQERIQNHAPQLRKNETKTRYALVDPLLRALGWNVEDPGQVAPEYETGGGRADYALLAPEGRPALFIEVKALGKPLSDGLNQSINYCIQQGVQYFGVTDGANWEVYDTHKPVPIAQKKVVEFSLHSGLNEFVLRALWLWRGNHVSRTPAAPPVSVQDTLPPLSLSLYSHPLSPFQPPTPEESSEWIPFSELNVDVGNEPPLGARFPDGTEVPIRHWADVPIEVIKWLVARGILGPERWPIQLTQHRHLVNVEPIHPDGKKFTAPRAADGFWVETNYNAPNQFNNARFVLEKLGQDTGHFSLRF